MDLHDRRTLGRSGLLVSPLALGAMTFGNKAWGSPDDVSLTLLDAFLDHGGNFIDTADVYSGGRSEELLGRWMRDRSARDTVVLATKWSFNGGNGRKNLHRALEASLRRLQTDSIDLYWMHVWDSLTPPEETLESLVALVRAGKIRYFGLSDVPSWYVARMATLAEAHGVPGPIALQLPYSLIDRTIEQEHLPATRHLGLGLVPWSPLGAGFLTGKYTRNSIGQTPDTGGRLDQSKNHPMRRFTERNWAILDTLREVADEAEMPLAQLALAWVLAQPAVTSGLFGASTLNQNQANLGALVISLTPEQKARLDRTSALDPGLYALFEDPICRSIFGEANIEGWR